MSAVAALAAVVGVGLVTYAMRAGVILLLADRPLPLLAERVFRSVGPAVLAALAINLAVGGADSSSLGPAEAVALVVAAAVAAWRRSVIWTVLAGMSVLWVAGIL